MWIRSQNKEALVSSNNILIDKSINGKIVICVPSGEMATTLGSYPTKEQAIIVLNMIESHINEGRTYVFEMPKE